MNWNRCREHLADDAESRQAIVTEELFIERELCEGPHRASLRLLASE